MTTTLPFRPGILAALTVLSSAANAQIIVSDPNVPPAVAPAGNAGYYLTDPTNPFFNAGGVTISFDTLIVRTLAPITRTPTGADESASFNANMDASGDVVIPGTGTFNDLPSSAAGIGSAITLGKAGNTTGTFPTEMLSLSLSGSSALGPYMIRESPTLVSPGQTSVTDLGGGSFRIDSYFDVFMEISIDGGQTWFPDQNGSTRLTLVPEPGMTLLAGLGGLTVFLRRRRA
jgi:hypothetical protein